MRLTPEELEQRIGAGPPSFPISDFAAAAGQ
jgi:hypothetical protein